MWTFLTKCWNEILIEPQFEDITIILINLNAYSQGRLLNPEHRQADRIRSEWFLNNLPTRQLYLEIARLSGVRGLPYDLNKYSEFVSTVTFRWFKTGWKPVKYTVFS